MSLDATTIKYVDFSTVQVDTHSMYIPDGPIGNNIRAPMAGIYQVEAGLRWGSSTADCELKLWIEDGCGALTASARRATCR